MPRVVLIDDTPEIAELLTYALRDHGFSVYTTGYVVDVNELIDQHQAEGVVINCSVYKMSEGIFDSLRENPDRAEFPVIIISDTPEIADQSLRSRNAQKVYLVPKPFTGSQVARALTELMAAA